MKNKIIICHIPYQDNENDNKTSKDDNKKRWLIVYSENEKYIYCYNITTLTESKSHNLRDNTLIIKRKDNIKLLKNDSIVKLNKIYRIEKFNGIEKYFLSNIEEISKKDMTNIIRKTKLIKNNSSQKEVQISKGKFMLLNENN